MATATAYDIEPNADDPLYEFLTQRPVNNKQARLLAFEGLNLTGEDIHSSAWPIGQTNVVPRGARPTICVGSPLQVLGAVSLKRKRPLISGLF